MPLHPTIKKFLDSLPSQPIDHIPTLKEIRRASRMRVIPIEERPEIAAVQDRSIPGPAGDIPIRIYTPDGDGPFPLFLFFHGGGFVAGDLDTHDVVCRQLANFTGHKVIAVDYRLAPEHPYPAALDDCYAALEWMVSHSDELQGDLSRLCVGGDSAGGNLATVLCLKELDLGTRFISKQVLLYPVIDYDASKKHDLYRSYDECAQFGLTPARMNEFWRLYIETAEGEVDQRYLSPITANDLGELPPAIVLTAEYDVLRDEGEAYAEKLEQEGVAVTFKRIKGVNHGYLSRYHELEEAKDTYRRIAAFLNEDLLTF